MLRLLRRVLAFLGLGGHRPRPDAGGDPFAYRSAPRRPTPNARRDAVAVAEPDE